LTPDRQRAYDVPRRKVTERASDGPPGTQAGFRCTAWALWNQLQTEACIMSAQSHVLPLSSGTLSVADVVHGRLDYLELRHRMGHLGPGSLQRERRYLGLFSQANGVRPASSVNQGDLVRWLGDNPHWRAHSQIIKVISILIACFRWATEEGLLAKNPFRWPKDLQLRSKPRPAFEAEEFAKLMQRARHRPANAHRWRAPVGSLPLRFACYFLWRTGARPTEMRRATWLQVDWSDGVIRQTEHKTARKTGEERLIALDDRVLRLLRWIHRRRQPPADECIFLNHAWEPWSADTWSKHFRKWADRAGLAKDKSSYCLRHGFTVQLLERGASNKQAADLLGHKTTHMVDTVYGSHTRERVKHLRGVLKQVRRQRLLFEERST